MHVYFDPGENRRGRAHNGSDCAPARHGTGGAGVIATDAAATAAAAAATALGFQGPCPASEIEGAVQIHHAQRHLQCICQCHHLNVIALLSHGIYASLAEGVNVKVSQALKEKQR